MCLNQEISVALTLIGFTTAVWIYRKTKNISVAGGIAFYFAVELLHALQFAYAAPNLPEDFTCAYKSSTSLSTPCNTYSNKILTLLSFIHYCFQPLATHTINFGIASSCRQKDLLRLVQKVCFIGGVLMLSRYALSVYPQFNSSIYAQPKAAMKLVTSSDKEWFRGLKLCTFVSPIKKSSPLQQHDWQLIGTSIPLSDSTFYLPPLSLQGFLLYIPYLVFLDDIEEMIGRLIVLLLAGPFFASLLTDNPFVTANITCITSVAQLLIVVFSLRKQLFSSAHNRDEDAVNEQSAAEQVKSNSTKGDGVNVVNDDEDEFVDELGNQISYVACRDFINCPYCHSNN